MPLSAGPTDVSRAHSGKCWRELVNPLLNVESRGDMIARVVARVGACGDSVARPLALLAIGLPSQDHEHTRVRG